MASIHSNVNDMRNGSHEGGAYLYAQAKKGANLVLQTRRLGLTSLLVLILLPFLTPVVVVSMLVGAVFLVPVLSGVAAYYAVFHPYSLSSIIKWYRSFKSIHNQEKVLSTSAQNDIGSETVDEHNAFEVVHRKDEEEPVENIENFWRSEDNSYSEAEEQKEPEGEVAEYNVFHFDDRGRRQLDFSEGIDGAKEATEVPIQAQSEVKHPDKREDRFEESKGPEGKLARAQFVSEISTAPEEPEHVSDNVTVEEKLDKGHPGGRCTAPSKEGERVDGNEALIKQADDALPRSLQSSRSEATHAQSGNGLLLKHVIQQSDDTVAIEDVQGNEAPILKDAGAEEVEDPLALQMVEDEAEAPVNNSLATETVAPEGKATASEAEKFQQAQDKASSETFSNGAPGEQEAEAKSDLISEEKLRNKRQGSKARKRRKDKTKK
ncbi:uncharacterized protein [Physcomitrium patens]|uniref:Uncharacterized protein n=1 Tax=Physcomitrium patens TaxID=3218 RepID=A0A7I4AZS5_PHYPA|nr:uncharacterized protein LOC112293297 isoform X2 [Physcomitrium patens]|eukprot:XP_024398322.1 uncharacterized protein LOC112293297 isoform X2 [Physcomitrella patens]